MKTIVPLILLPSLLMAAELVDRIVAIVGSEVITLSDLKKKPLEALIRERLFHLELERGKIEVTDEELAQGVQEVLAKNRMTLAELKSELARKGSNFEEFKKDLRREIQRMKFLGQVIYPRIQIPEEEVLRRLGPKATDEERLRLRQKLVEERLSEELENYLDEVRRKTYVEIKK